MMDFLQDYGLYLLAVAGFIVLMAYFIIQKRKAEEFEGHIDMIMAQNLSRSRKGDKIVRFLENSGWTITMQSDDIVAAHKPKYFNRRLFWGLMLFSLVPAFGYALAFMARRKPTLTVIIE